MNKRQAKKSITKSIKKITSDKSLNIIFFERKEEIKTMMRKLYEADFATVRHRGRYYIIKNRFGKPDVLPFKIMN